MLMMGSLCGLAEYWQTSKMMHMAFVLVTPHACTVSSVHDLTTDLWQPVLRANQTTHLTERSSKPRRRSKHPTAQCLLSCICHTLMTPSPKPPPLLLAPSYSCLMLRAHHCSRCTCQKLLPFVLQNTGSPNHTKESDWPEPSSS